MAELRTAMTETGWTVDALAAALSATLGREIDRGYCWRLVNNEKPWRQEYTSALPDDLEGRWYALGAERLGHIVVKPLTGLDAQKALVAGLIGLMSAPMPARADRMAKAELPALKRAVGE